MPDDKQPTFEEALTQLETIVNNMEQGALTLEESMNKFEEAMKLTQLCGKQLGETEAKVEILLKTAGDAIKWKEFGTPSGDE